MATASIPRKAIVLAAGLSTRMYPIRELYPKSLLPIAGRSGLFRILDMLKNFSEQPLTFTVDEKTFGVEVNSENGKFKLSGYNPDEYPKLPELESPASVTVSAEVIGEAINRSLFATGNDDLRPVMSYVHILQIHLIFYYC